MTIHKEGKGILIKLLSFSMVVIAGALLYLEKHPLAQGIIIGAVVIFFLLILQFFRSPNRTTPINANDIIAPADGKVVVIEDVEETEYFNEVRKQVSIFMSPVNVHNNRTPIKGIVKFFKYHAGKYLVAWHPKASTENERTTMVVEMENGVEILVRQIAGALAKRICWYVKPGDKLEQGEEYGFIKFGSRVDIYLPVDAIIKVNIDDKTRGGETVIASFS